MDRERRSMIVRNLKALAHAMENVEGLMQMRTALLLVDDIKMLMVMEAYNAQRDMIVRAADGRMSNEAKV